MKTYYNSMYLKKTVKGKKKFAKPDSGVGSW